MHLGQVHSLSGEAGDGAPLLESSPRISVQTSNPSIRASTTMSTRWVSPNSSRMWWSRSGICAVWCGRN